MAKWTIHKGFHASFSNFWQRLRLRYGHKPVKVRISFDHSCWFRFKDNDDLDINKLFGYSMGWHHENSVRIGWRPDFNNPGKIELFFYTYNNSKRFFTYFATIDCSAWNDKTMSGVLNEYEVEIYFMEGINYLVFELFKDGNQIQKSSIPYILPNKKLGYYLWFYFGGNKTAPQTMSANIKIV